MYVVFFEILNRERDRKTYSMPHSRAIGFLQFLSLVSGLVAMGWLSAITHDHDGHHIEALRKLNSTSLDQRSGFMAT